MTKKTAADTKSTAAWFFKDQNAGAAQIRRPGANQFDIEAGRTSLVCGSAFGNSVMLMIVCQV